MYRGTSTPLTGNYIFGIFGVTVKPKVYKLGATSNLPVDISAQLGISGPAWPKLSLHGLGEDWAGELYLIRVNDDVLENNGQILRIE